MAGDISKHMLYLRQRRSRIDVADNHENCVAGRVPLTVEVLEHLPGCLIERILRTQRIMRIRRAGKHVFIQPAHKLVSRIG